MFRKSYLPLLVICLATAFFSTASFAAEHNHAMQMTPKENTTGDPYTLSTCPVTGEKLGSMGDPVKYDYKGREIRFCCSGCIAEFEKKPEKYIEKIDAATIEDQLPYYPVKTCLISGAKLGGMGVPINTVYKNRLVQFCCPACKVEFEKNPQETIAKLDKAVIAKQKDTYPLDVCVVSGEKLSGMGEPVNLVIANRLVRLCCPNCVEAVKKDPVAFLSKLGNEKDDGVQTGKMEHTH